MRGRSTGLALERRIESVTESLKTLIQLTADEQAVLEAAGRLLAKGTGRFGAPLEDSESSLIHVHRVNPKQARVTVAGAVGVVATPTMVLQVAPKIPARHLLYILREGDIVPRSVQQPAGLDEDDNLAVLIAHWFVLALERLLEFGLARDYRLERDEITTVRGRLAPLETARLIYRGRLAVVAEFEDFDFDTPLNRLVEDVPLAVELRDGGPGVTLKR